MSAVSYTHLADLRFDYDKDWQILNLREGDGTPVTVYLEEGIHTISLDVTLGEDSEIVNLAQQALYELNAIYRKLIMQTGANPDKYRDYQIEKKMPDVLEVMKSETEVLEGIFSLLYGQSSGEDSASITKLIWQLKEFLKEPESIPASMSVFQSNITAFGSWLQEKTSQPLCIDYFEFLPANQSPSKANNGFLSRLSFSAKQFLSSFAEDYGVIGSVYSSDEAMTVWLTPVSYTHLDVYKRQVSYDVYVEDAQERDITLTVSPMHQYMDSWAENPQSNCGVFDRFTVTEKNEWISRSVKINSLSLIHILFNRI